MPRVSRIPHVLLLILTTAACIRAAASSLPPPKETGDAWLNRLPERYVEDSSATLDANLEGLVCRVEADASFPCEALRGHRHHRPIQPDEIPTLERMLDEMPSKTSEEYGRMLSRLVADYLELSCVALRECLRDQLNPPKGDPQAARKEAEIQRKAEEKFQSRCAELLRLRSEVVKARELCAN